MKPTREPSAIFGLRYLEEEDLEINDIVGCQAAANPSPLFIRDPGTYGGTNYVTNCDTPDYDTVND